MEIVLTADNLFGIIITYHPDKDVIGNIKAICLQLEHVIVVDNGSPDQKLAMLREAAESTAFDLVSLPANVGIAAALNLGVQRAKARGAAWVVLLDQDSTMQPGFVRSNIETFSDLKKGQPLGLTSPVQIERGTGKVRTFYKAPDGTPLVAITSGSCIPVSVIDVCGGFDEGLFIDGVDHDFCLRIRNGGYVIAEALGAKLLVSVGNTRSYRFLNRQFTTSHHSPTRRYYMTRNRIVLFRRFHDAFPVWTNAILKDIFRDFLTITLFEDGRFAKLSKMIHGAIDGIRGRLGPMLSIVATRNKSHR